MSEKVATPTSVVLMAFNSVFGTFWRHFIMGGLTAGAWGYFKVCAPVVVIGAPFGSLFSTHFHRLVLACCVYVIDLVSIVSAFVIIKPTGSLLGMSLGVLVGGFLFFFVITKVGDYYMDKYFPENPDNRTEDVEENEKIDTQGCSTAV